MKISAFHLMPHRELPADFEQRYESVWVTPPWWELADARRVGQYYNWTLDELLHAARSGFDGLCTNEHHQNAYGFMPSPNLMGSVLAKLTQGTNVAIVQMGSTLPTSNPPIRVAEEYAMLDCISGGRLVAGLPLGSPMDVNLCYGITPMEQRERYREAFALTLKAWQAREIFAWNGRYYQLANVNLWPRPVQEPHPPVWVPGSGSVSTFDFAVEHDVCYCFLSYSGARPAKTLMDGYWEVVSKNGRELNPYRAGFLQLVAVSETDARAEAEYARHVEYFYHKCLHVPTPWFSPPGNQDYRSLLSAARNPVRRTENPKDLRYRDFAERGYVIAGSPATVRQRLEEEVVKGLRVGNLMLLVQIGSMPHELALKNITLLGSEVLPHLRGIWDDEGWVNHWWPRGLRDATPAPMARARGLMAPTARTVARLAGPGPHARPVQGPTGPAVVFFHGPWGLTWDPVPGRAGAELHGPRPGASRHQPRAPRRHLPPRRRCGIWSSATTSCWMRSGSPGRPSWATPSAAWSPARWRRPARPASTAWCSSTRSASGATTARFPTGCSCVTGTSPATSSATPTARPRGGCSRRRRIPTRGSWPAWGSSGPWAPRESSCGRSPTRG